MKFGMNFTPEEIGKAFNAIDETVNKLVRHHAAALDHLLETAVQTVFDVPANMSVEQFMRNNKCERFIGNDNVEVYKVNDIPLIKVHPITFENPSVTLVTSNFNYEVLYKQDKEL